MKTIKVLASMGERVYVYLKDEKTSQRFLYDAVVQGFTFADGVCPTERHWSDLYAIHPNGNLNYVGTIGHIAFGSGTKMMWKEPLIRIDYEKVLSGADDCLYEFPSQI